MAEPLALVLYQQLIPGTQLVTCLEDRGYRVQSLSDPAALQTHAEREKPMLIIADQGRSPQDVYTAIRQVVQTASTAHLPIIALVPANDKQSEQSAREAGAKIVVNSTAVIAHLDHLLDVALDIE